MVQKGIARAQETSPQDIRRNKKYESCPHGMQKPQVHTYRLYGTLYPEIRNADMRVGYDAYSRYAIGDTIRVYATSSGRVVPVSTVEKMRIWHIGSRGLASEHLPELFGLIGGGLVLWRCANRRRS